MAKNQTLPAFKIGSDWRFNRESIDSWRVQEELPRKARVQSL
jgi:hypothetical protein